LKNYLSLLFSFSLLAFTLAACGYKPTTHYVKKELGYNAKYYVNMHIAVNNAKNSVIIKDAINEAIISRFAGKLVSNSNEADTIMNVSLSGVSTSAIQYDTDVNSDTYGYANLYRTSVSISVSYTNKSSNGSFSVSDSYEFAVDGSAIVSETKKFQAIKNAASKAFDKVISNIAVRSITYQNLQDTNTTQDINATK
jgi:hypothetical protein